MSAKTRPIATTEGECVHHWLLEPPSTTSGGMSAGACRNCGATRTFTGGQKPTVVGLTKTDRKAIGGLW